MPSQSRVLKRLSELPVDCPFEMTDFRRPHSSSTIMAENLRNLKPDIFEQVPICEVSSTHLVFAYIKVGGKWMLNSETTYAPSISHLFWFSPSIYQQGFRKKKPSIITIPIDGYSPFPMYNHPFPIYFGF